MKVSILTGLLGFALFLGACSLPTSPLPSDQAAESRAGAGIPGASQVFIGSAFYLEELLDRSQWSYVADNADGLYDHPVGHQDKPEYRNISAAEWKILASHFRNKKAIIEGDMLNASPNGDLGNIQRAKDLGFVPFASFVNRIPATARAAWIERIRLNKLAGVDSYTMLAPHVMERYPLGFYDPAMAEKLDFLTLGSGTSVDAPTQLYVNNGAKYRQTIFDAIDYSHKNNKGFMYLISPNTSGSNFLAHTQQIVRDLEDRNLEPEFYAVELYGLRPYTLTPETVVNAQGKPVSANTITGVAHWLIKHLRADEQELDLWLSTNEGTYDKGALHTSGNTSGLNLANWRGANGTWTATVQASNRSNWLELSPMLKGGISGLGAGWTVTYKLGGTTISAASLASGIAYVGANRLAPGATSTLQITLTKTGATALPVGTKLQFALYSHKGGQFLRDTLQASVNPISALQVNYTFANSWNGGATVNLQITNASSQNIQDWSLSFQLPPGQTLVDSWNATVTGSSGTISARALEWNKTIAAGGNVSFGFNIQSSGAVTKPASCTLNGQVIKIAP